MAGNSLKFVNNFSLKPLIVQTIFESYQKSHIVKRQVTLSVGEVEESEGQQTDAGKVPSVRAESEDRGGCDGN